MELQALFWYQEGRFKEAKSEASRAVDIYERTEATSNLENCRALLRDIRRLGRLPTRLFNARFREPPTPHLDRYPIPDRRTHYRYYPYLPLFPQEHSFSLLVDRHRLL